MYYIYLFIALYVASRNQQSQINKHKQLADGNATIISRAR